MPATQHNNLVYLFGTYRYQMYKKIFLESGIGLLVITPTLLLPQVTQKLEE